MDRTLEILAEALRKVEREASYRSFIMDEKEVGEERMIALMADRIASAIEDVK